MPRNRVIYQNEGLFVGPAPASGYSFIDELGNLGNAGDFNLVFPLHRVQSVEYSINPRYNDISVLGKDASLHRPQIEPPQVDFTFDYIQNGVLNELRMGFYANYEITFGPRSGEAYYPNNTGVFLLSGFLATDMSQTEANDLRWPLQYRDRRNLYLAQEREGYDLHHPSLTRDLHPNAQHLNVMGVGNCYITNYTARAEVGDFPRCSVSYVGENVKFYSSGSGLPNPAVDSKSGNLVQDRIFNIPNFQSGSYHVSALLPGDITLDINSSPCLINVNAVDGTGTARSAYPQSNLFENLGVKYSDLKIQSYELNLPLNRRDLRSLGYKLPLNRVLEFPINYSFSMSSIVGDSQTGDFTQFMRQNDDYDITVKLNNPKKAPTGIAVRYDIRRAKLQNIRYNDRIGSTFKICEMEFNGDLDPTDLSRGLFMSGQPYLPDRTVKGFLLQETEDINYVLTEDSGKIIIQYVEIPQF